MNKKMTPEKMKLGGKEGKNIVKKEVSRLLKQSKGIVDTATIMLKRLYPEGLEQIKQNIREGNENGNTAVAMDPNAGIEMTFGVRKAGLDKKPVILASVGIETDDGESINILSGLEDEILGLTEPEDRDEVQAQMDAVKFEGVDNVVLEVIYPGGEYKDLKGNPIAARITVYPSGLKEKPFVLGLIRGLKQMDPVFITVSRRCMETMKEMTALVDKLLISEIMNSVFNTGESVKRVMNDREHDSMN